MNNLSHLNENNQPGMVNVAHKQATHRIARARAVVALPAEVSSKLCEGELSMPKGPVFETAIIAGTMAAKKTGDLIPLCHPLGLDGCKLDISMNDDDEVIIEATCEITHKTGVEMEALTAVSLAALTLYDMAKAVDKAMRIDGVRLVEKTKELP